MSTARARKRNAPAGSRGLRVRMYRVGFGDFFLMTVPTRGGDQFVLIDCGVHSGHTGKGDIGTLDEAVEDLYQTTGGKLALIVVTHRHADHIAGFLRAERFADFEPAKMVWMPYWEEPDEARSAQQAEIAELAQRLAAQFCSASGPEERAALDQLRNATGEDAGDGERIGTNERAIRFLRNHLGNNGRNVRYYKADDTPQLPDELKDAELSARILGPPGPGSEKFLRLEDFKQGIGQYLDSMTLTDDGTPVAIRPFAAEDEAPIEADGRPREYPRESLYGSSWNVDYHGIAAMVSGVQPHLLMTAAAKIENFLNNQSLVVLFTFQGRRLLFVGDAQAGNWEHWLYDVEKPVKNTDKAGPLTAESRRILDSVDFYKVGHHGSTNATPIPVVKELRDHGKETVVAMCSTQPGCHGSVENDSEVPRVPLMGAIAEKCTLVRSDAIDVTLSSGAIVKATEGISLPQPRKGRLTAKSLYVEYSF